MTEQSGYESVTVEAVPDENVVVVPAQRARDAYDAYAEVHALRLPLPREA